jgi:hypothetical protein
METLPHSEVVERTARLCDSINRELAGLGDGAALAVPFLLGWFVAQLAKAQASDPAGEQDLALEAIVAHVRRAWADAVRRADADKAGDLH